MLSRPCIILLLSGLSLCQRSTDIKKPVPADGCIVYVVGDVHKTGGVVMNHEGMTVLTAIAMAGGPNPNAALNKALLIRNTPAGRQDIRLKLNNLLAGRAPDLPVQAGDIIFVPKSSRRFDDLYDVPPSPPLQETAPLIDR